MGGVVSGNTTSARNRGTKGDEHHRRVTAGKPGYECPAYRCDGACLWQNKTKRPDLGTLAAVAQALEVEPGELIGSGEAKDDAQGIRIPGQVIP